MTVCPTHSIPKNIDAHVSPYRQTIIFDLNGVLFNHEPPMPRAPSSLGFATSLKPVSPQKSVALLDECKQKGHLLILLSSASTQMYEMMAYTTHGKQLFRYFDDIVLGESFRYRKPDPRIFTSVMDKHALIPSECIFIDDQRINLDAAEHVGITKGILCQNFNFDAIRSQLLSYGAL